MEYPGSKYTEYTINFQLGRGTGGGGKKIKAIKPSAVLSGRVLIVLESVMNPAAGHI